MCLASPFNLLTTGIDVNPSGKNKPLFFSNSNLGISISLFSVGEHDDITKKTAIAALIKWI